MQFGIPRRGKVPLCFHFILAMQIYEASGMHRPYVIIIEDTRINKLNNNQEHGSPQTHDYEWQQLDIGFERFVGKKRLGVLL